MPPWDAHFSASLHEHVTKKLFFSIHLSRQYNLPVTEALNIKWEEEKGRRAEASAGRQSPCLACARPWVQTQHYKNKV